MNRLAKVQFGGVSRTGYQDLLPEAGVGDCVLVHVRFAISKIDEVEAQRTYALLDELGNVIKDEAGPPESGA